MEELCQWLPLSLGFVTASRIFGMLAGRVWWQDISGLMFYLGQTCRHTDYPAGKAFQDKKSKTWPKKTNKKREISWGLVEAPSIFGGLKVGIRERSARNDRASGQPETR